MERQNKTKFAFGATVWLGAFLILGGLWFGSTTPAVQAACDRAGQRYCNGNYVMEYYTRFGSCNSRIVQTCSYQCSDGACVSAPPPPSCSDDGSTCNYSDSCDTTGTNNCGTEVSRCNRTTRVDRNWAEWTDTSMCSASCGPGTKTQARNCLPSSTQCGGTNNCTGDSTRTVDCNLGACPTCEVRSVCSDPNTVYTRNADCSYSSTNCPYGCYNGVCNSAPPPVNAACGSNATTWDAGAPYYTGTFCSPTGISSSPASPSFPTQGGSVSWTCLGQNNGSNASCAAYRKLPSPSVNVSPTTVASGNNVTFSWGAVSNAGYYSIQYSRDGNWGSWINAGNNTSVSYSTTGLSQSIAARAQACNSTVGCGSTSNTAQASIAPAPTADIQANSSNGPVSVAYNTSVTISWSSSNASSCSVSPTGWTGTSDPGRSTGNLTSSQTYTLSCTGTGGTTSDSVTVNVASPTLAIDSFTASPSSGAAPLNNVDFTASVSGNAIGTIHYQIDCTNNGSYERDVSTAGNPYTAVDACNYSDGGSYTAKVVVGRSGVLASQTLNLSIDYQPVNADIKVQYGANPASDTAINVPVGASFTLSWTASGATSCRTGSGGTWPSGQSLSLVGGAGSASRTMSASTETYPIICNGPGGSDTDSVTVNPVPNPPTNLRLSSGSPSVKGNPVSFAWDAAAAASFYSVTFYANGNNVGQFQPSPGYVTSIAYSSTSGLNTVGAAVAACRSAGVCSSPTAILTINLTDPTPTNTTSTTINTTASGTSGYSGSLTSSTDVQFVRVPTSTLDEIYRLQISGTIMPTIAIVDANGNNIVPTNGGDIVIGSGTATFKVPANAAYYVKFTGASGSYTYGFQRYRSYFPYYQGR